ncbi:MAG: HIT domain-containing protein [Candidatus Moraniibacteriota bacterium]
MRILDERRKKYKKNFTDKIKCAFCRELKDEECLGLRGEHWRVLVNINPYMDGNVMIVSLRHIEKIGDITDEEWKDFGAVLAKTEEVLKKIFKVDSLNVGLNVGPESGASMPHIHWQVVPRKFKNITVMNTFADLYIVAISGQEAKKLIDKETKATKLKNKKTGK